MLPTDKMISRQLAEWAALGPPIRDPDALDIAAKAFADTFACMIGGVKDPAVAHLVEAVAAWNHSAPDPSLVSARRLPPPFAALINGTSAHVLDFDDNYIPAFTHCSAVMVPALLAVGEMRGSSGMDLLDAYIVGAELHARIGMLVNPGHFNRGWHSTATVGTMGTAGACARLMGLDAAGICTAMSIGFSMAAGSKLQFGSMMKPVHAGLAAQHAVMAAEMAHSGITAQPGFLIGDQSFQDHYAENEPEREPLALQGLGGELCLSQFGLLVKRFPCCGSAHKSLDGFVELRERHQLQPENINRATSWLPETMSRNLKFESPTNEMEARFSLHYAAARILSDGKLSLQHFESSAVTDSTIRNFLPKIRQETIPDPENLSSSTPLHSRIEMKDGTVHDIEIEHLRGSLQNPLTEEDLRNKLDDCLRFSGFEAVPEPLSGWIAGVDECLDVRNLMHYLVEATRDNP